MLKSGDLLCGSERDLIKAADAVSAFARDKPDDDGAYRIEIYTGNGGVEVTSVRSIATSPNGTKCGEFYRDEDGHLSHYTLTAVKDGDKFLISGRADPGGCLGG